MYNIKQGHSSSEKESKVLPHVKILNYNVYMWTVECVQHNSYKGDEEIVVAVNETAENTGKRTLGL